MPKFLDVPQWYNSSGALETAWDSRGRSGQLLKADGDGTVSWSSPLNFETRSVLLGQADGGANVTLYTSMLNYTFLNITVQSPNYHSSTNKPFWQILLVPSLFYDYCSQSSDNFGLYWSLYLESAGYLNISALSDTNIKWSGTFSTAVYRMYVYGIYLALD